MAKSFLFARRLVYGVLCSGRWWRRSARAGHGRGIEGGDFYQAGFVSATNAARRTQQKRNGTRPVGPETCSSWLVATPYFFRGTITPPERVHLHRLDPRLALTHLEGCTGLIAVHAGHIWGGPHLERVGSAMRNGFCRVRTCPAGGVWTLGSRTPHIAIRLMQRERAPSSRTAEISGE